MINIFCPFKGVLLVRGQVNGNINGRSSKLVASHGGRSNDITV